MISPPLAQSHWAIEPQNIKSDDMISVGLPGSISKAGRVEYFSVILINVVIQNIDIYVCDWLCKHCFG